VLTGASSNETFRQVAASALSRRALLGLGAAGAVALTAAAVRGGAPVSSPGAAGSAGAGAAFAKPGTAGLAFQPIAPVPASTDALTVPAGFTWQPIIRWGDPLFAHSPEFDITAQTPEAQAGQFGYNSDYLDILADPSGKTGVLVNNHEYVNPNIMFPTPAATTAESRIRGDIYKAAQGLSVVEIRRDAVGQPWSYVRGGRRNRRITVETVFELTGPAAGTASVKTAADPAGRWVRGTLGNCAGGTTPWGTILSGEENFDGYFAWAADTPQQKRYRSTSSTSTSTGWEKYDPRFDAHNADFVNEPNRFGYIVEIDPTDPTSTPRKHTAMGRFKHEGANVIVAEDGRVVAYMGDDERNDYMYKFVSKNTISGSRKKNLTLLSEGDLYVAKFSGDSPAGEITGTGKLPSDGEFDGSGQWLPLTQNGRSVVPGFTTEGVLVCTRLAADAVGATKMDRPEDVEPNPKTGKVYAALTNNSTRGGSTNPVERRTPSPGTATGTSSSSPRRPVSPEPRSHGASSSCAATRPSSPTRTSRASRSSSSRRCRAPTTSRSTPRAICGSRPTARRARSATTTACSRSPSKDPPAGASSSSSRFRGRPRRAAPSSTTPRASSSSRCSIPVRTARSCRRRRCSPTTGRRPRATCPTRRDPPSSRSSGPDHRRRGTPTGAAPSACATGGAAGGCVRAESGGAVSSSADRASSCRPGCRG
jgi:secreted PhoX family phosphatase